ncbi:MarR family winged helix-turn-helix transcriptional regulator [Erwinia tasmaniensis]|uniref:MarR family winged helix-turn-helix transcriptional regulator n=1 Tax=Erwinia tasmaniensis TaxID=338565 RepID=UPI003A4E2C69
MNSQNFMFLLGDIRRNLLKLGETLFHHEHLTIAQARVLFHLERNEGIKQAELADILDVAPITLARVLNDLEALALIERRKSRLDRRILNLFLTPTSRQELEKFDADMRGLLEVTCRGISAQEIAQVTDILEKMDANIISFLKAKQDAKADPKRMPPVGAVETPQTDSE